MPAAPAQTILLHDHRTLAKAEPKTLRYRLLHVAARLVRGARRLRLRLDRNWPWATALADAFTRCAALPNPPADSPPLTRRTGRATNHDHPTTHRNKIHNCRR